MSGANLLRESIKLSFKGVENWRGVRRYADLSGVPSEIFVPVSHLSRWARSRKRNIILAFALWLSLWQAARCQEAASSTLRTSWANWMHLAWVACSSQTLDAMYDDVPFPVVHINWQGLMRQGLSNPSHVIRYCWEHFCGWWVWILNVSETIDTWEVVNINNCQNNIIIHRLPKQPNSAFSQWVSEKNKRTWTRHPTT